MPQGPKPLIQGPPAVKGSLPRADPNKPPSMADMIMEALGSAVGVGNTVDPFADARNLSPRDAQLGKAGALGAMLGILSPGQVKRILPLLKVPARMPKTAAVWEEFKRLHPGSALISNVADRTGELPGLAAITPRPLADPANRDEVLNLVSRLRETVQAPEAPVINIDFPRKIRNPAEALQVLLGDPMPSTRLPGRQELSLTEAVEDFDPTHIYGILGHEVNHAAQQVKTQGKMAADYSGYMNRGEYFDIPYESRSRFSGYKAMADRLRRQQGGNLTPDQRAALRALQDDEDFFGMFTTPNPIRTFQGAPSAATLIRQLLNK